MLFTQMPWTGDSTLEGIDKITNVLKKQPYFNVLLSI